MINDICMGCFESLNGYEVCSHCGWYKGAEPSHAYHLYPGTVLKNRYIVGNSVGVGGFGITYRAWDANLNILVAIKEFYPAGLVSRVPGEKEIVVFSGEKKEQFDTGIARFLEEAKTMAKFNGHSNIVSVYDFFEDNNTAYIVMEFLDGINLKQYLESLPDKRLDEATTVMIANKVLDAMGEIHSKGVIHRDISPDNIQITMKNEIKIFDLGAARLTKGDREETRSIVVKTGYTPPEQYRGKSKQGPFTDLYSVGALLYKMLTGVTPEESIDRTVEDNLKKPSKLGVKMDSNLERAIMKALALKPELRFQNAAQFKEAIANKKIVDFPEEELKKRRKRRIIISSLIAAFSVTFFSVFGVYMYNFTKGVNYLAAKDDTISVCLPYVNDEQKEMYNTIIEEFVKYSKTNETEDGKGNNFEVKATYIPQGEYKEKLLEMIENKEAPTVFSTDFFGNSLSSYAAPLDDLIKSISDNECIIYDDYEEVYPSKREIPTGIYLNVIYANQAAARTAGITIPDKIDDVSILFDSAKSTEGVLSVAVAEDNIDDTLTAMIDEPLYSYKSKKIAAESEVAFKKIDSSFKKQGFDYTQNPLVSFMSNQLVYYIDDTTELSNIRVYLPGYYNVLPLVNNGELVVSMTKHLGVDINADENKQHIGMQFIRFMLSNYAQDVLHTQYKVAIPVNEVSLKEYINYNNDIDFVTDYIGKFKVMGEARLKCYEFNEDVRNNILLKNADPSEIQTYIKKSY